MKAFRMRNFKIVAMLICLSVLAPTTSAFAGIPVMDLSNFAQNLIAAIQSILSVINDGTQLVNQGRQISNQLKSLDSLGSSMFGTVNALSDSNVRDLNDLLSNAQSIKFNANQVGAQFDSMFPPETEWSSVPIEQYGSEFDKWNNDLSDAARFSMHAQTVVNRVRDNYGRIKQILDQSDGADGEVRQIQAANQSLAVVSSQLGDITQTLVAGQRVTSTTAAVAASEKRAKAEASGRLRKDYTDVGPNPAVVSSLPTPN